MLFFLVLVVAFHTSELEAELQGWILTEKKNEILKVVKKKLGIHNFLYQKQFWENMHKILQQFRRSHASFTICNQNGQFWGNSSENSW